MSLQPGSTVPHAEGLTGERPIRLRDRIGEPWAGLSSHARSCQSPLSASL
jgi:hypothetical protein